MDYDKKFLIGTTIPMVIFIIITSILHHVYPEILQVPNVRGPYFTNNFFLEMIIMDIVSIILSLLVFYNRWKTEGLFKATCFLYDAIIFAGFQECFWILGGRYHLFPAETYFFTIGGAWFLEIPLWVCLGWYVLACGCIYIAEIVFPKRNYVFHAFFAGIIAMSLDFFIDPVAVNIGSASIYSDSMGFWVWLSDPTKSFSIFSIPFFNFIGWFLVIFLFLIFYGYLLNDEKIEERGKNKTSLFFFGFIIVLLGICVSLIFVIEILFSFLNGINIIPIGIF